MRAPSLSRPLSRLSTSVCVRLNRQWKPLRRPITTASPPSTAPTQDHNFYRIIDPKTKRTRTAFAVYPPTGPSLDAASAEPSASSSPSPSARSPTAGTSAAAPAAASAVARLPILQPPPKKVVEAFDASQIRLRDPTGARTALFSRSNRQAAHPGDVVMVTMRRGGEPFSGVVLSIRRAGIDTAMLVRGQLTKTGVEMWYKIYSSRIAGIEIVHRRPKRARRARLTYMRKPKHDMGSVDHLVAAWHRTRRVVGTKGRMAAGKMGKGKGKGKGAAAARK